MSVSVLPKGTAFTRIAMAKAVAKGDCLGAAAFAANRWGENSPAALYFKSPVAAGTTEGGNWGNSLVGDASAAAAEFIAMVRQQTIIGRLSGIRRIPVKTAMLAQTGGASASWVKEGGAVPVSKLNFARDNLSTLKVMAMVVVTDELLRSADPNAENIIRTDLIRAVAYASDLALIDPLNAGVPDEQPASLTHGVTPITVASNSAADIAAGLAYLVASFSGDIGSAYFVGHPALFAQLAATAPEHFPNVGARGGEIFGIPALPSKSVPLSAAGKYQLALIDPTGIGYVANDGASDLVTSSAGTIEMETDPADNPTTATVLVSLWQVNATAIAARLHENWKVYRAGSVALLTGITPTTQP